MLWIGFAFLKEDGSRKALTTALCSIANEIPQTVDIEQGYRSKVPVDKAASNMPLEVFSVICVGTDVAKDNCFIVCQKREIISHIWQNGQR